MLTKQQILKAKLEEYLQADKAGKNALLDHLESITGYARKAIIRRLSQLQMVTPTKVERRGRKELYNMRVTVALKELWKLFNELCAERLHPQLSEYVNILKIFKLWEHSGQTTELLLQMSLATVKRRISGFGGTPHNQKGKSVTKPSLLKEIIPIRRGPWDNPPAGKGEVDTVAHCGVSLSGDYAFSLQYTDVATIWTCLAAQWNKGQMATLASIQRIKARLPFSLLAIDPDSGTEFINYVLNSWCKKQRPVVEMTRIRPYYKNDHARIEQKNYVNIRQFLGYTRIEDQNKVAQMNELFDYLEDYINFFLPSQKCIKKQRIGSKYKRVYDQPRTAYRRVLDDPNIKPEIKSFLTRKYATLNPVQLKKNIDRLLRLILKGTSYLPR